MRPQKFKFGVTSTTQHTPDGFFLINYKKIFRIFDLPYTSLKLHQPTSDVISLFEFIKKQVSADENSAVVLTSMMIYSDGLDPILSFIKSNNIKKLFLFIDDVVRLYHPTSSDAMDSSVLEKYPLEVTAGELDVIKFIQEHCNIDIEIYHNEANAGILSKKYNYNIKYFDCFSVRQGNHLAYSVPPAFSLDFNYTLSCFNLRPEVYRSCIAALLYPYSNALVTLNHRYTLDSLKSNQSLPLDLLSSKDEILTNYSELLTNNDALSLDIPFKKDVYHEMFTDHQSIGLDSTLIPTRNSFVNLVTETRFCSPMPNIGEKTLKPIAVFRPFIIMAAPNTLQLVRSLGFKTFDRWWDESYDNILNHHERFEAIYNLTVSILKKDKEELTNMLQEMSDVLTHNYNNLKNIKNNMFNVDLR